MYVYCKSSKLKFFLCTGRLGRIGHGELRGWSVLLSRKSLKKAVKSLKVKLSIDCLLEVKLHYDPVCTRLSVRSVGLSVCHNFLKVREVSLPCSNRSSCNIKRLTTNWLHHIILKTNLQIYNHVVYYKEVKPKSSLCLGKVIFNISLLNVWVPW